MRDTDHGKPYKDIDMFIGVSDMANVTSYVETIDKFYGKTKNVSDINPEYLELGTFCVYEGVHRFSTPLQFIFYKTKQTTEDAFVTEVGNTFDFGINQIFLLDNSQIITSHLYKMDSAGKIMTIVNCQSASKLVKLMDKFKRLTETKYKNWKLDYKNNAFQGGISEHFGNSSVYTPQRINRR